MGAKHGLRNPFSPLFFLQGQIGVGGGLGGKPQQRQAQCLRKQLQFLLGHAGGFLPALQQGGQRMCTQLTAKGQQNAVRKGG